MKHTSSLSEFTWCPKLPDFTLLQSQKIVCILASSDDPGEMPLRHFIWAFAVQKYPFRGFQVTKG